MALHIVDDSGRAEPGKLACKVVGQILDHIRDAGLHDGGQLTETGLAAALNVSRTPVRSALEHLAELKVVRPAGPRRGYHVIATAEQVHALSSEATVSDEEEELYVAIAQDFLSHRLNEHFSEADMLRQYPVSRATLLRVLQRMGSDRVIERNPGYGWRFVPQLRSIESHDESYRFRLAIEPTALAEPGFTLDRRWAERSRRDHLAVLETPVKKLSMVRFFEMNAEFHETLALCSNNAFFHQAVQQQNQIRRFQNYNWTYGEDRVASCCHEHIAILDALEASDGAWAATLMRRHLELASQLKPVPVEQGQEATA